MITKTELEELKQELKKKQSRLVNRKDTLSEVNDQINEIRRLEIDCKVIEGHIRQYIDYNVNVR